MLVGEEANHGSIGVIIISQATAGPPEPSHCPSPLRRACIQCSRLNRIAPLLLVRSCSRCCCDVLLRCTAAMYCGLASLP